jgi:hypothetical protein
MEIMGYFLDKTSAVLLGSSLSFSSGKTRNNRKTNILSRYTALMRTSRHDTSSSG